MGRKISGPKTKATTDELYRILFVVERMKQRNRRQRCTHIQSVAHSENPMKRYASICAEQIDFGNEFGFDEMREPKVGTPKAR